MGDAARRPGEEYQRLPPAAIDPTVKEMFDRLSSWINTSSGTKVLQTLDYPQGSAFATVNAIIQAAVSVLDPFKQLAEQGIADSYRLKVAWLKHKKADLTFYQNDKKDPLTYGQSNSISWEQLPEQQDLYMTVELKPSIPTDEMARINAATMLARDLNFPTARLMEQLDVPDPQQATEEWRQEQRDNAALQNELSNLQLENALEQERIKLAFQQEQQAAQQAQQQGGAPSSAQGQTPANNAAQAPFQSMSNQGSNAAAGGTPTNAGAPEMMREQITGNPKEVRGLDMGPGGA
jgi:type I site-specific restriction-modification system R (restriction) subunit